MKWSDRTGRAAFVVGVIGTLAAATITIPRAVATGAGGPVVPVERNCWDRTQWGRAPLSPPQVEIDGGKPAFMSHDLTSNRGHALPVGVLQVVTFYDGDATSRPTLRIEHTGADSGPGWIEVTGIHTSTSDAGRIDTFQYDLGEAELTGSFQITGVTPNGVIDGLAFGLFWRDIHGFHVLRSTAPEPRTYAALVGAWPIALNDRSFERRTPQLGGAAARSQAKMALYGAEYLDNGAYLITIQERAVALHRRARVQ